MNKKDEQKKSYRILSYIFLVCGTINFILLFFNGDGFIESFGIIDDIGFSLQWMRLVFSVICLPLGIIPLHSVILLDLGDLMRMK